MSLVVVTQPIKTVNGKSSSLVAALSQILYEFKRIDYDIETTGIQEGDFSSGGFPGALSFEIDDAADVSAEFEVGDNIYLIDLSFDGVTTGNPYTITPGVYTIYKVEAGPPTRIWIDNQDNPGNLWPDAADDEGENGNGSVNTLGGRPSYRLELNLALGDDPGTSLFSKPFVFSPLQNGDLLVDIAGQIVNYMAENNLQEETFVPSYRENWTGKSPVDSFTNLIEIHAIAARKPILSRGGANMGDFVLGKGIEGLFFPFSKPSLWTNAADGGVDWTFEDGYIECSFTNAQGETNIAHSNDPDQVIQKGTYGVKLQYILEASAVDLGDLPVEVEIRLVTDAAPTEKTLVTHEFLNQSARTGILEATIPVNSDAGPIGIGFKVEKTGGTADIKIKILDAILFDAPKQGKFLTEFNNPVVWNGWARTVSFIMDNQVGNRLVDDLLVISSTQDINGSNVSMNVESLDKTPERIVNFVVSPTDTLGTIDPDALGYAPVSEELTFEIREECANPVMVVWQNQLGGFDSWLFDIGQTLSLEYDKGLEFERPITQDIENVTATKGRQPRFTTQKVRLIAEQLLFDQAVAISNIKISERVLVWLDRTGLTFVEAVVSGTYTSTFRTKPQGKAYQVELELELPDNFLLNTKGERAVGQASQIIFN